MPHPADPSAIGGSAGDRTLSSPRGAGRARARGGLRTRASDAPSRWALALFWASVAFTGFALVLLVASFLP